MSEHRDALEDIMRLCAESRTYTRRTQQINEVAMRAVGMTQNQRTQRHMGILDRSGGDDAKNRYLARQAKRAAKREVREDRLELAEAPP